MSELAYVLSHGDEASDGGGGADMERAAGGWSCAMVSADVPPVTVGPVTGVVYIPGLLAEGEGVECRSR